MTTLSQAVPAPADSEREDLRPVSDTATRPNGGKHPTMRRFVDKAGEDWYPTPAWATHALCAVERFEGAIWEPACGDGAMVRVLYDYSNHVEASDRYDRGFGKTGVDFPSSAFTAPNIITNPPFNLAEEFVHAGLRQSTHKLCLLLRLAFLEGAGRQKTIFQESPPSRVWVFSERITFYPGGIQTAGSGTLSYAWFCWDRQAEPGPTILGWLPLGMKAKHSAVASRELGLEERGAGLGAEGLGR
jgi:hypothetical protein